MRTSIRRLDEHLEHTAVPPLPSSGWIRAVRDALGMSGTQLATRMGIGQSALSRLEQAERDRSITLGSLDRAAAALGCHVEYVLVPNRPLARIVDERAREVAESEVRRVDRSMALEQQRTDEVSRRELIERRAVELRESSRLWDDAPR